jgi:hypothetical protein
MANTMYAVLTIKGVQTEEQAGRIYEHLKEKIAYGGAIEYNEEFDEDYFSVFIDLKWSLTYMSVFICELAKAERVEIQGRGEDEGIGFYEVLNINNVGEITRSEELAF